MVVARHDDDDDDEVMLKLNATLKKQNVRK